MAGVQNEVGDHNYVGRQTSPINTNASGEGSEQPIRRSLFQRRRNVQILQNSDHDYLAMSVNVDPNLLNGEPIVEGEQTDAEHTRNEGEGEVGFPVEPISNNSADEVPAAEIAASTSTAGAAAAEGNVIDITTPSVPPKKRKRASKANTPRMKPARENNGQDGDASMEDNEDDGFTCPICLDNWEMSGEHRLVSLRCGHLFGDACIRRWLTESARQTGIKACPQCKTKATQKDIRCLYAKRLRAIDRSEEHRLRDHLDSELHRSHSLQSELTALKMTHALVTTRIQALEAENERMKLLLRTGGGGFSYAANNSADAQIMQRLHSYKLFMERNIEVSREPGCRVMVHADRNSKMIVTQRSSQNLFPGYGLRFIDTPTFRTTNFIHASARLLRDLALSADQQMVAVASMESRSKLFDMRSPQIVACLFTTNHKTIWSCALDRGDRDHFLYLGSQQGSTYVYDFRRPDQQLCEFQTEGDLSPVVNVACMPANNVFPCGGIIVCKLQSLWFYEYSSATNSATPTRLNVEGSGPFIAMNFEAAHETLLITARSNTRYPHSRYLLGQLHKIDEVPVFKVNVTFMGSKTTPVMSRCTQIAVEGNTLVAGYIQDAKLLALFDARREIRLQSLPVHEVVYDTCPVYTSSATYLAGLTENKCRIYKLTQTS